MNISTEYLMQARIVKTVWRLASMIEIPAALITICEVAVESCGVGRFAAAQRIMELEPATAAIWAEAMR